MTVETFTGAEALHRPVGIFDAGIGSYDLVRRIRAAYPRQDVLYLADRASFPYGAKSEEALLASVGRAAQALESLGAGSIILASNAPSVTVLEPLRARVRVPILGVVPPVRSALASLPGDSTLVVAGASVLIQSPALGRLIADAAGLEAHRVHAVAADGLIGLVESGAFLDFAKVEQPIAAFIAALREQHPRLRGLSLSSTHLPWLAPAIAQVAPGLTLFDPADEVVEEFAPLATPGSGRLVCIATESEEHPLDEFQSMLTRLRLDITPALVEL
ncbi:glutamate racemase [Arthrobacter sp. RCC_34]|uniref:glutamate racemase n=1 Tax=Arthrobacter sp. RCC_34 TaxID=3239230 RepID=UPI003524C58C